MEVKNRNTEIILMFQNWLLHRNIDEIKEYLATASFNDVEKKALYVKFIEELKKIIEKENEDNFNLIALKLCDRYLNIATGKTFNQTKYTNDYRKERYKQLNVDVPIDVMKEFEDNLKEHNINKKTYILNCIINYNNYCNRKKKK